MEVISLKKYRNFLIRRENTTKGGDERVPQIKRKEYKKSSLKRNGLKDGALFHSLREGSLTVETALVLPWFLFAMVTVMFLFRVLQLQYMVGDALDKAVAQIALLQEEDLEKVENEVKLLFYKELKGQDCQTSIIAQGMAGFSWENSQVDETYIDMEVSYKVKMPGWILKNEVLQVTECSRCRRWTGLSGSGEDSGAGEWVYVTPEGSVYHKSRDCTHLKLSIQSMSMQSAVSKYRACERCVAGEQILALVYVTDEGECYHFKLNCSGLKRTVFMVPLTEAEGRSPCSRCGGR